MGAGFAGVVHGTIRYCQGRSYCVVPNFRGLMARITALLCGVHGHWPPPCKVRVACWRRGLAKMVAAHQLATGRAAMGTCTAENSYSGMDDEVQLACTVQLPEFYRSGVARLSS